MGLLIARSPPVTVVVVPRSKMLEAAKALAECGCFHPSGEGDERLRNLARRLRGEIEVLAQRIRSLLERIGEAPEARAEVVLSPNIAASTSTVIASINKFLEDVEEGLAGLAEGRIGPLREYVDIIERYSFIDVDLAALSKAKHLRAVLFRVPAEAVAGFEQRMQGIGAYAVGFNIEDGYVTYVVVYPPDAEQAVLREASEAGASLILLPRVRLTRRDVEELARKLKEALLKLEALAALLRVIESAHVTKRLAVFTGYVAEDALPRLTEALNRSVGGLYTVYARPLRGRVPEELPTEFRPPRLLKPFVDLLEMYGLPAPGEFVPLLLMAITYPIIFGMMFPDAGHGLVLLLFGLYLLASRKVSEGWKSIGQLLVYVSIAAIFFGILAAEFFGPVTPVAEWIYENLWHGHPPYGSPVHEIYMRFIGAAGAEAGEAVKILTFHALYVSLALGSVLLALASWLGVWRATKERDPEHFLATLAVALGFTGVLVIFLGSYAVGLHYEEGLRGTLPVIYAMFGGEGLPAAAYVYANIAKALIGLALVIDLVAPIVYGHEPMGTRLILAFVEVFDLVLVILSNTLSFVRIMGIMLAHSGLMYGFYVIAAKAAGAVQPSQVLTNPAGLAIYVIGNIFVIGFEAFIASIQTLRLHFYEMFTKFYEGRGRRYRPVKLPPGVEIKIAAAPKA